MSTIKEIRELNKTMIEVLVRKIEFKNYDKYNINRQIVMAFSFGMLYARGFEYKLSPENIHGLAIAMLIDIFSSTPEDASKITDFLINAASDKKFHDTINAIIHAGIDGYEAYKNNDFEVLHNRIENIMSKF